MMKNGDINRRLGSHSSKISDRYMIRYIAIIVCLLALINTISTKGFYFSSSSIGYVQSLLKEYDTGMNDNDKLIIQLDDILLMR